MRSEEIKEEEIKMDSIYEYDSNLSSYTDESLFDKCCQILGLSNSGFTINEYNKAYRELAKKYHPDKHVNKDLAQQQIAEKIFKAIQFAHENIGNFFGQQEGIERLFIGNRAGSTNISGSRSPEEPMHERSFFGFENISRENIHEYLSNNVENLMKNSKFSFELFSRIERFSLSKQEKDAILIRVVHEIIATREDHEILHIANRANWTANCLAKFEKNFEITSQDFTSNFFDKLMSLRGDSQTVPSNDLVKDLNQYLISPSSSSNSSFLAKILSCGSSRDTESNKESLHGLYRILRLCRDESPQAQYLAKVNDLSNGRLNRREVKSVLLAIDQKLINQGAEYSDLKNNFEKKFKDPDSLFDNKVEIFLLKAFSQYEAKARSSTYSGR